MGNRTCSASMLVLVGLAACTAPTVPEPTLPDLSGDWSYRASAIRPVESNVRGTCEIEGMSLHLGPWRFAGMNGRTSGGELICGGDLEPLSGPLPDYAVKRGGMVAQYFSFDIGTADWRHEGAYEDEVISGSFRLRNGLLEMTGTYEAVRAQ